MGNRWKLLLALLGAVALLTTQAGPSYADFHIQGLGVATSGSVVASPGFSDTAQPETVKMDFDAVGAAYYYTLVSVSVVWDCSQDATEEDLPPDQRHGFTLTSGDLGDTSSVGSGTAVGKCSGFAPDYPDYPIEVSCPDLLLEYVRVGSVIQLAGTCVYNFGVGLGNGDFTLTAVLDSSSGSSSSFGITAVAFRYRA